MPDLTTSARRDAMDSVDLAALDFLVGAIADDERVVEKRLDDEGGGDGGGS